MKNLTQPLREEHQDLYPQILRIRQVADQIGEVPVTRLRTDLEKVYDFLANHLKPHAEAEDAALYPVVQKALGSSEATKTMSRDHAEIGQYIDLLKKQLSEISEFPLTKSQIKALQATLYGVYGIVKVHFAKEEEIYLPILEGWLTPETAQEMFDHLDVAAHEAHAGIHQHG